MRALPAILALAVPAFGCSQGPLELGPAATAIYLGVDTDLPDLIPLRAGAMVTLLLDVRSDRVGVDAAIGGATLQASTGGRAYTMFELEPGLYASPPAGVFDLVPSERGISLLVTERRQIYGLAGPLPDLLELSLSIDAHPADTPLVVPLPRRWARDYDQVLAQLLDHEGTVLWSNYPQTLQEWLDFVSDPPQPDELEVPGDVLPAGTAAAMGVTFLRQMDLQATFAGPIDAPFSTLIAGTAWLVPVGVAP